MKAQLPILENENFVASAGGTHYRVFLSKKYAIRFRDNNPKLLLREADFLKQLDHQLIPKILWTGKVGRSTVMVENRLLGKNLNLIWKSLPMANQRHIIKQVIQFLQYLKTQTKNYVYSVNTGKKYDGFLACLTDTINQKITKIKQFKQTGKIIEDLLAIINIPGGKRLFSKKEKIILVHGDLITHNLLTDGKNLTGVLDWELALFGDPDYDLFRLFYYQECAKAYQKQGIDETFEADYMDKLVTAILGSDLIENNKLFWKKYQFVHAIFHLNALDWAANSNNPEENFNELITQWNKKSRVKQKAA
ncbi:MAG: hypothetical protein A2744_02785 [Candidatus Buchananbacteria bacterium RIFCSPHIGHO2_01_FULL_44_11]|uniref:Aminoglycoside phosphotransferase domain-containing protein n=1 Tax=Candidatus Buchananbacteria bacterium RIFCSPHIGHO2_01_FULL_44_11 TaxID=1797535 RepID=A0A1G1XYL5_9BACT|nr:MAG: hypothetical protein A2744_02785 [Candidatus Buchananbacteria bacterium RIFCSPHIGHO2_01_FULL_44_11]